MLSRKRCAPGCAAKRSTNLGGATAVRAVLVCGIVCAQGTGAAHLFATLAEQWVVAALLVVAAALVWYYLRVVVGPPTVDQTTMVQGATHIKYLVGRHTGRAGTE